MKLALINQISRKMNYLITSLFYIPNYFNDSRFLYPEILRCKTPCNFIAEIIDNAPTHIVFITDNARLIPGGIVKI